MEAWAFDVPADFVVVTTTYVTRDGQPILQVTREQDEEDGSDIWQFHCGNGDYDPGVLQLVRLDTVLKIDPGLRELAQLPVGSEATRTSVGAPWEIKTDPSV